MLRRIAIVTLLLLAPAASALAQDGAEQPERALVVGIKASPPFVVKQADGTWGGLSVELWKMIAADLGVRATLRPFEQVPALLDAVERRELDVAIGAITITGEREGRLDFTAPIYSTGLAIATRPQETGLLAILRPMIGWQLALLLVGLLGLGGLGLFAVRRRASLRLPVAAAWVAVAVVAVAAFAASAAVDRIALAVRGPDDLGHIEVATVPGSTSAEYLSARRIGFRPVATPADGLRAVADGEVTAVVYDAPILANLIKIGGGGVALLPGVFEPQSYGFAVPEGSPLREQIDRHLARRLAGDTWRQLLERHLGAP
jgi:polar amino acid transport system substrate-binding protein